MRKFKLKREASDDIGFAKSCFITGAINRDEFNEWVLFVINNSSVDELPLYIYELIDFNGDFSDLIEIIGFTPDPVLNEDEDDALYGLTIKRFGKSHFSSKKNRWLSALDNNPHILARFIKMFPFIDLDVMPEKELRIVDELFFSCSFQNGKEWVVAASKEGISSIGKERIISISNNLERNIGYAKLEFIPEPEIGISELSAEFDGENYLFHLLEYGENGDVIIRTKTDFNGVASFVYFNGEPYPSSSVIDDFDFVKKVFVQLLEIGDVSNELMSN